MALVLMLATPCAAEPTVGPRPAQVEEIAAAKLGRTHATVPFGVAPHYTVGDAWATQELRRWNSAFLPGSLWYEYQRSGESSWAVAAVARQSELAHLAQFTGTMDLGFIFVNSFARSYRFTGNESSRRTALAAASTLAQRYAPRTGVIRTFGRGDTFRTIVDTMMNTELLWWGADNGGPAAWRKIAATHAQRTAQDALRPDGSTYHYVEYDERTGAVVSRGQIAGLSTESTWSRGQAWVIYGMATAYRETGDPKLLEAARAATDYWASHVPEDLVPYWDFDDPAAPDAPRDSSAAAIAASGFAELARLDPDSARRAAYLSLAEKTVASLSSPKYLSTSDAFPAVLDHGTYLRSNGSFNRGTIWGDHYFREALMRLGTHVCRLEGPDRYVVAARASQSRFGSSEVAVITSGEKYPDALSASSLAGVEAAPLLLTQTTVLPNATLQELKRLGASRVMIVGGPASVGDQVVAEIKKRLPGVAVDRVGGGDR